MVNADGNIKGMIMTDNDFYRKIRFTSFIKV